MSLMTKKIIHVSYLNLFRIQYLRLTWTFFIDYVLKAPPNLAEEISEMANASTSRTSSLDVIKPLDLSATLEGAQQLIPDKYMAKRIGLADVRMMSVRTIEINKTPILFNTISVIQI